jgi:hypothetical protein
MIAILLTAAGLVACYLLARQRFAAAPAAIATLGVGAGSGVFWYASGSDDPYATVRLAAGSLAAYGWVRASRGRSPQAHWAWAAAGIAMGLAAALLRSEPRDLTGTLSVPDVLWSSRGGLLATSPAVCLSVIGLGFLLRVDRPLAAVGATLLVLTTLFVSAHAFWWTTAWPAPVAFVALTPYFVCGAAAVVDAIGSAVGRRPVLAAGTLLAPLLVWNLTFMKAGTDATFHLGEPMSFGDVGAAQAQALHRWIGHPPAMPANLAFGLANGVHPSAYDLLASNRLLAGGATEGEIDIGERDSAFVGEGWHGAERDTGPGVGPSTFRWATKSATLLAPLDHAADLVVDVVVRPYRPPTQPPQQLTLVVNGVAQAPVTLASGWHAATFPVARSAWRSGINHLELRFAYDARPSDAGIPDGRSLASSVDVVKVRVAP